VAYAKEACREFVETLESSSSDVDKLYAMMEISSYNFANVKDNVEEVHVILLMLSGRNQVDPSHCSQSGLNSLSGAKRSHSENSDSDCKTDKPVLPAVLERDTLGEVKHKADLTSFGDDNRIIGILAH